MGPSGSPTASAPLPDRPWAAGPKPVGSPEVRSGPASSARRGPAAADHDGDPRRRGPSFSAWSTPVETLPPRHGHGDGRGRRHRRRDPGHEQGHGDGIFDERDRDLLEVWPPATAAALRNAQLHAREAGRRSAPCCSTSAAKSPRHSTSTGCSIRSSTSHPGTRLRSGRRWPLRKGAVRDPGGGGRGNGGSERPRAAGPGRPGGMGGRTRRTAVLGRARGAVLRRRADVRHDLRPGPRAR